MSAAARWAVVAAGERKGLHGCRKAARKQVVDLSKRGVEAEAVPAPEPAPLSLPIVRFGSAS